MQAIHRTSLQWLIWKTGDLDLKLNPLFVPPQGNASLWLSSSQFCVFTCQWLARVFLLLACTVNKFPKPIFADVILWNLTQGRSCFLQFCVINNISLIRPSTVPSCSLINAQKRWAKRRLRSKWFVIISDVLFAFSGNSWIFPLWTLMAFCQ